MKKNVFFTLLIFILIASTVIFATDTSTNNGYAFDVKYEGEIKKDVQKEGTVTLTGTNATPYTNVRIKVDLISGPATPKILATDSAGTTYDIAEIGYWGPPSGFAVGGTFVNETPIKVTYPEAGTYVSKLSLIDLNNNNAVITSKEFTITVTAENQAIENQPALENNVIEEIPQTGISIWTYITIIAVLILAIIYIRKLITK